MATFSVTDQTRRAQFTANGSTTEFSFSFQVNNTSDIKVDVNGTIKTESTHYDIKTSANSIGLNADGTGKVVFRTSPSDHTPSNTQVVTIFSDHPLSRSSVYTSGGNITAASLENDFDTITMILASHEERINRAILAPVSDAVNVDLTLPSISDRASTIMGFDVNGAFIVGSSLSQNLVFDAVTVGVINSISGADIDLKATGGQVNITGTSGQNRFIFDNDATPTLRTFGAFDINADDTVTISSTGDFTANSSGDIILDADGGEIFLKDGGSTKFTFRVSAAGNRILSSDTLQIQTGGSGDIILQPAGGQVNIVGTGGQQRIDINNDATPTIKYYQNSNTLTLAVDTLDSTRTITLPNATDTLVGKATTDTLTNKTLTSAVLNTGVSGTAIKDEDNMSSNSATHLATQQSIKAYVDSSVASAGSGDISGVIAGTGLSGGGTSGTVTLNINATNGLTATSSTLSIDSTVVTLTGSQTLTNKTLTNPTISSAAMANPAMTGTSTFGGTNGVSISQGAISIKNGGTQSYVDFYCESSNAHRARVQAPAHSDFSGNITLTLPATTDTLVGKTTTDTLTNKTLTSPVLNTGVSGTAIKDEDNFASNSATHLATQQSIKAYVDGQVAGGGAGNLSTVLGIGNTTAGNNIVFGDSSSASDDRLIFGAGSDLQIYHDGSASYVSDTGTGGLKLMGSDFVALQSATGENYVVGGANDATTIYHNNVAKLATTSSGVDVKNVASGANAKLNITTESTGGGTSEILFSDNTTGRGRIYYDHGSSPEELHIETTGTDALVIDNSQNVSIPNGNLDIEGNLIAKGYLASEATNSTNKWLAYTYTDNTFRINYNGAGADELTIDSSGNVNIVSSSNVGYGPLQIGSTSTTSTVMQMLSSPSGTNTIHFGDGTTSSSRYRGYIHYVHSTDKMSFGTAASDKMVIDGGNVGIGTSSITSGFKLDVIGDARFSDAAGDDAVELGWSGGGSVGFVQAYDRGASAFRDLSLNNAMTIKSSGNVGIGTSGPQFDLHIHQNDSTNSLVQFTNSTTGSTSNDGLLVGLDSAEQAQIWFRENSVLRFATNDTERMRIDSSGNLLVGKTSVAFGTEGVALRENRVQSTNTGNAALELNRLSDNGEIIGLYKDSSKIGSIGSEGGYLKVQGGNGTSVGSGLLFTNNVFSPRNYAGNSSDGVINFGESSARFHTGYFSNGTSSSSDQNEKQDIAELTATELAVSKRLAKTFRTYRRIDAVEVKGDNARTHTGTIAQQVHAAFAAEGLDAAKYGMYMSDTWTNDDGNEQTRLMIRYEQLLSFISAGADQRLTDIETRLAALEG